MTTTITIITSEGGKQSTFNMTVGDVAQKHVLRSFNPERDEGVHKLVDATKALCAGLIQQMIDLREAPDAKPETKRAASIAITLIEGAQMQAVKANFVQA